MLGELKLKLLPENFLTPPPKKRKKKLQPGFPLLVNGVEEIFIDNNYCNSQRNLFRNSNETLRMTSHLKTRQMKAGGYGLVSKRVLSLYRDLVLDPKRRKG